MPFVLPLSPMNGLSRRKWVAQRRDDARQFGESCRSMSTRRRTPKSSQIGNSLTLDAQHWMYRIVSYIHDVPSGAL